MAERPFRNLGILSIFLTLVTVITKSLAFVREVLVSAWFGASHETDAFYLVFSLLLMAMVAGASQLPRVFVPEYQRRELSDQSNESTDQSTAYLGSSLILFLPLAILATVAIGLWTEPLISLAAPKLPASTHDLAVELVRLMLPVIPCITLIAVLSALAHARGHLLLVQLATPLLNIGGVAALLLLGKSSGIRSLTIGLTVGSVLQCLVVAFYVFRERIRPRLSKEAMTRVFQGSGVLALLWLVRDSGGFLLIISERYFATGLPEGHLSCMGYALRLVSLPNQILFGGLLVALLPALSNRVVHQDSEETQRLTLRALRMLLLVAVPTLMGMALVATPLVQITYGRGAFDAAAASLTAMLVICYVPSLLTEVVRLVIVTLFFANARPGPAICYGLLRVICLTAAYALSWESYGAIGMVVSLSIVDLIGASFLMTMAHKMLDLRFASLSSFLVRLGLATGLALLFAWLGLSGAELILEPKDNLARSLLLSGTALSGVLGFVAGARLLGLTEVDELFQIALRLLNKRLGRKPE